MTVADPTLKSASTKLIYTASDGYRCEMGNNSKHAASPQAALIGAIDELARVLALFGFEAEARAATESAFQRVAEWRKTRKQP